MDKEARIVTILLLGLILILAIVTSYKIDSVEQRIQALERR